MHAALSAAAAAPSCSLPRHLSNSTASTSYSSSAFAAGAPWSSSSCSHHHPPRHHRQERQRQQPVVHCSSSSRLAGSGAPPLAPHQQQQCQQRRGVVARITGKREEYVLQGIPDPEDVWGEEADSEFIEVDTVPIWSPEKGPVHERIFNDPDEERASKSISIEDTAYWFAENNAGELPRTQMLPALKEVEVLTADEDLVCEEVEGCPPRLKLSELEEGDELAGIITDNWLWHGAFVDVMAEYKGLIPMRQRDWQHAQQHLWPGTEVVVRVHKIYDYPKYRFPLQLELLTPAEAAPLIMAPDEYQAPANIGWMYDQGMTIKEVTAALGREYEDEVMNLEPDMPSWADSLEFEFGHDAPDGDRRPGDWLSQQLEDSPGLVDALRQAAVDTAPFGSDPARLV